jgi:hypothetical protein
LFPTCWQVRLTATSLHQLRLVLQEAISHAALLANLSWKKLVVLKQDDLPMEETMSRRLVRVCIAVKSRCWQGSNTKHRPR